jgi:hypothetical protein
MSGLDSGDGSDPIDGPKPVGEGLRKSLEKLRDDKEILEQKLKHAKSMLTTMAELPEQVLDLLVDEESDTGEIGPSRIVALKNELEEKIAKVDRQIETQMRTEMTEPDLKDTEKVEQAYREHVSKISVNEIMALRVNIVKEIEYIEMFLQDADQVLQRMSLNELKDQTFRETKMVDIMAANLKQNHYRTALRCIDAELKKRKEVIDNDEEKMDDVNEDETQAFRDYLSAAVKEEIMILRSDVGQQIENLRIMIIDANQALQEMTLTELSDPTIRDPKMAHAAGCNLAYNRYVLVLAMVDEELEKRKG